MNLVICDDDPVFIKSLKTIIEPIVYKQYPLAKFFLFSSGKKLLNWYIQNKTKIDILFIDVEMPNLSGVETIKQLREQKCPCLTIFISAYKTFVFDTLDYDIENYLIKPIESTKIILTIEKVLEKYRSSHNSILIYTKGKHISLPVNSIIFIESDRNKVTYHTISCNYTVYDKISRIEKILEPYAFLRTHKSFLINMNMVINYQSYHFLLVNKNIAEISHVRRSEVIKKYTDYLENKFCI